MKAGSALLAAVIAFGFTTAFGAERQPDAPLVVNGDVSLTTLDFEAYLQRVPENSRDDFRANIQRVKPTVDSLWITRAVAAKGRAAGLADDPIIAARMRQAAEGILADAYLRKEEAKLKIPDLAARALELYKTRPEDFRIPEQVRVQHILVSTTCGRAEALKKAQEIQARVAKADEAAFLAEAEKSSDDPSADRNKGDLGLVAVTAFEAPFAEAISKMKKPGEVSGPVETRRGFHIIRFVAREPARVKPFDEVKEQLIAGEKQKLVDAERNRLVNLVRDDPKTHLHLENVEALTRPANRAALATEPKPR